MDATLGKYLDIFRNIKVSNRQGMKAPHKAILLLTVISMIEDGDQVNRNIVYSDTLKEKFKNMWFEIIGESNVFHPDVAMPFWHLKNEKEIWSLILVNDSPETLAALAISTPRSTQQAIRKYVKYAVLPEELFHLLEDPIARTSLVEVLFEKYIYV